MVTAQKTVQEGVENVVLASYWVLGPQVTARHLVDSMNMCYMNE